MYTKLISVATRAIFDAIQGSNNPVPEKSIVIIEDTKQIWTHGVFINGISISNNSNDIIVTSGETSYNISTYYHKKQQDIDLGTYLNNVNRTKSYILKAGTHNLIQYTEENDNIKGINIGEGSSKILFNSSNELQRYYLNGTALYTYPILDTSNTSLSLSGNKLSYKFGSTTGDLYLVRHDTSDTLPENDSVNKFSRIGASNTAGWMVMNVADSGNGDYYALKITNTTNPSLYIKRASASNYVKIISENDTFAGATISNGTITNGTKGIVPAPTSINTFLKSDGTWSSVFPTFVSGCYLHVSSSGALEWIPDESSSYTDVTLSSISLQTSWSNIDNLNTRLSTADGSYALQITYGSRIYTGIFSYTHNGYDIDDEIILHCSGTKDSVGGIERGRLYAKLNSNNNNVYLQMATSQPENTAIVTIKYKKLI